jgi:hypothetical protein
LRVFIWKAGFGDILEEGAARAWEAGLAVPEGLEDEFRFRVLCNYYHLAGEVIIIGKCLVESELFDTYAKLRDYLGQHPTPVPTDELLEEARQLVGALQEMRRGPTKLPCGLKELPAHGGSTNGQTSRPSTNGEAT